MTHFLSSTFSWIFGSQHSLSWAQECARAVLVFVYGLVLVRLTGRRVFGKWSALDIVVSIIVGSNLSRTLTGGAPLPGTLAATTLLMGLHWIIAHLAARVPLVSRLVEGAPIVLAENGAHDAAIRKRHGVTEADLAESLRQSGLEAPAEAKRVTLEPSGRITVLKD